LPKDRSCRTPGSKNEEGQPMNGMRRTRPSDDDGFTLIEVVVALSLMSVVMLATLGVFIGTMKSSSLDQRRQGAVQAADQAMEQVRAVTPTFDASGLSQLVAGRTSTAVAAQWSSVGTLVDTSQTNQAYDPNATAQSTPVIPLTQAPPTGPVIAGQPYTVNTLIGTCYLTTASVCNAANATGSQEMFRVIVLVTWAPGAGVHCANGQCAYSVSTLIDPGTDPTFNLRS